MNDSKEKTDDYFTQKLNEQLCKYEESESEAEEKKQDTNHNTNNNNQNNDDIKEKSSSSSSSLAEVFLHYANANTPITMSNNNSETGSETGYETKGYDHYLPFPEHVLPPPPTQEGFKKLSFHSVEKSLEQYYDHDNSKYINELDILITYLNGQKHVYIQSKKITGTKLNLLMIPALILSASLTIFIPLTQVWWNVILVSLFNGSITLLISLITYFKLESTKEMYGHFSNQYEKLQTKLEFTNNKLLFIDNKNEQRKIIYDCIVEMETKINEIKELSEEIPEELHALFPIISHINIFTVIKKIEGYKKDLVMKFRDIKNEIRYIRWKEQECDVAINIQSRLLFLLETKEKIREQLMTYKNTYYEIDAIFNREILYAENYRTLAFFCSWIMPTKKNDFSGISSTSIEILRNYIRK